MSTPVRPAGTGLPLDRKFGLAKDRLIGCYVGQAIGGSIGAGVRTLDRAELSTAEGAAWPEQYPPVFGGHGLITGETQVSLFVLDAILRAGIRRRRTGVADPLGEVRLGLRRWLQTQEPVLDGPADGWWPGRPGLAAKRWPDHTTLTLVRAGTLGTPEQPVNDSRSATVLPRAAAAALWSADPKQVFDLGARIAALTHGHPIAWLSAGAYAVLVHTFLRGLSNPSRAVYAALDELARHPGHEPVSAALSEALRRFDDGDGEQVTATQVAALGAGWDAHEALAMAVHAAFSSPRFDLVLGCAVGHPGNTGTVGSLAASLLTSVYTFTSVVPVPLMRELELGAEIATLADGAATEFGPEPFTGSDWFTNFPIKD
ncbi:ADP-ribosylglycohydrolase family protein [Crossiella sp. CA198]|uniref:ADP-ribosylglycohydrolase family protein n=1 Tax=Crossiella sp. CA198 TaxID=3455607 RepID=UPI003F8D26FB